MNFSNFLFNLRRVKNAPAANNAERVLLPLNPDNASEVRRSAIVETVSLAAAASVALTTQLPAGARVVFAGYYLTTAMALTTAVKLGIGVSGTPSGYLLSGTTMTIGTTESLATADSTGRNATAATILLSTCATGGTAAGSGTGTVKVVVIYEYLTALTA